MWFTQIRCGSLRLDVVHFRTEQTRSVEADSSVFKAPGVSYLQPQVRFRPVVCSLLDLLKQVFKNFLFSSFIPEYFTAASTVAGEEYK